MGAYELLREAVLRKSPVRCTYHGYERLVCPHTLGAKNGRQQVLTFQYGGGSTSGLPEGGEWRCMLVGDITNVEIIEGGWHTDTNHSQPQTCVDQIDVEVSS